MADEITRKMALDHLTVAHLIQAEGQLEPLGEALTMAHIEQATSPKAGNEGQAQSAGGQAATIPIPAAATTSPPTTGSGGETS